MPDRTRAALRLLERMTLKPAAIDASFVHELGRDGLDELALREAANVGFHYNWINRMADAFDFPLPEGKGSRRLTRMLDLLARVARGHTVEPVWTRGADGHVRPTEIHRGRERILTTDGVTDPELRLAIDAHVAALRGQERARSRRVPAELEGYLSKLALHAYQIMDEDVEALRAAGHDDEWIYEVTHVGAFGAAVVGLERLFDSLYGRDSAA